MKTYPLVLSILLTGLMITQSCSDQSSKDQMKNPESEVELVDKIDQEEFDLIEEVPDDICLPIEVDTLKPFSFEEDIERVQIVKYTTERPTEMFEGGGSPIIEGGELFGNLGFNDFSKTVELDAAEVDSIKMIFQSYQNELDQVNMADCYFPRHCIHFFDKNDVVIAYLEICLQCRSCRTNRTELSPKCDAQYDELGRMIDRLGLPRR